MCGSLIVLTYRLQRSVGNSNKVSSAQSLDNSCNIIFLEHPNSCNPICARSDTLPYISQRDSSQSQYRRGTIRLLTYPSNFLHSIAHDYAIFSNTGPKTVKSVPSGLQTGT